MGKWVQAVIGSRSRTKDLPMTLSDLQYNVVRLHIADIERDVERARNADRPVRRALRSLAGSLRARRR